VTEKACDTAAGSHLVVGNAGGNGYGDHVIGVCLVVEGAGHAGGVCHVDMR
jgi:hypothetical protein